MASERHLSSLSLTRPAPQFMPAVLKGLGESGQDRFLSCLLMLSLQYFSNLQIIFSLELPSVSYLVSTGSVILHTLSLQE